MPHVQGPLHLLSVCSSPLQSTFNCQIVQFEPFRCHCLFSLSVSNIHHKEFSFGIDEMFPIFIGLITPEHKRHRQISTKLEQTHCINAQINWFPNQVHKFTIGNKRIPTWRPSPKRLIPTRISRITSSPMNEFLCNESVQGSVQEHFPSTKGYPDKIGLSHKEEAKNERKVFPGCTPERFALQNRVHRLIT